MPAKICKECGFEQCVCKTLIEPMEEGDFDSDPGYDCPICGYHCDGEGWDHCSCEADVNLPKD